MKSNLKARQTESFWGYAFGFMGQGASYMFVSTYVLLYMTDVAGLPSTFASLITSIALIIEVFAGMIIGNISDSFQSRFGRRRPFILAAAITMPFIMTGLFTTIRGSFFTKIVYYLLFSVIFRISFVSFEITAGAFGAEIADKYDDRIKLRTLARIFSILGNLMAYIIPLKIVAELDNKYLAWQLTGLFIGIVVFAGFFACFYLTRNAPSHTMLNNNLDNKNNPLTDILSNYRELVKLKTLKILIIYKGSFSCAFALYTVGTIYYMRYSLGIDSVYTSYMYIYTITVFLISTPFINLTALRFGKSNQQKYVMGISSVCGLIIYFIGASNIISAIAFVTVFSVMQTSFWQLSSSIFYDIVEVDEFVNGKRREGDIMSLVSVLGTLITAVMIQLFGFFLKASGYNPSVVIQNVKVPMVLNFSFVFMPSIFLGLACIALIFFPINKKRFISLATAVRLKKEHMDYSQYAEDLKKIT